MTGLLTTAATWARQASLVLLAILCLSSCGKPAEIDYAKLKYDAEGIFLDPTTRQPFTGIARESYPNGQPAKEFPMKNGKLHGLVREWYKNGRPSANTEYQNGERVGKNTEWNETGALYMERVYDHDHIVTEKKY